jgi:hypothetical protein
MECRIREKRRMHYEDILSRKMEAYNKIMYKKKGKKGKMSKKKK